MCVVIHTTSMIPKDRSLQLITQSLVGFVSASASTVFSTLSNSAPTASPKLSLRTVPRSRDDSRPSCTLPRCKVRNGWYSCKVASSTAEPCGCPHYHTPSWAPIELHGETSGCEGQIRKQDSGTTGSTWLLGLHLPPARDELRQDQKMLSSSWPALEHTKSKCGSQGK
jgi:hypothetical protein